MLIDDIRTDLTAATKRADKLVQRTLRSVIAAVQEAEVAGATAQRLDDDGVRRVIASQVKRRHDAADAFEAGGRQDRAEAERAEIAVLEAYLPAALGDDELAAIVEDVLESNGFRAMSDMGPAMKAVNAVVAGRADGRAVADLVRSRLS